MLGAETAIQMAENGPKHVKKTSISAEIPSIDPRVANIQFGMPMSSWF